MCYTNKQFENRITKLAALEAQIKALEAEKESIRKDIIGNMDADVIETPRVKINYTPYASARFDSKRFKEDSPDIYALYSTIVESRRFSYSLK